MFSMKIWKNKAVGAYVKNEKDEVALIVWRDSGGKVLIEWIPYCPMRDGTWKEFVYCFRIKYWAYASDLYKQAESEAEQ